MLESTGGLRVVVLASIALCIIASLTGAKGQDKNSGGLKIASVDIGRIQEEYTTIKALKTELDSKQVALQTQMQTWQQNQLLTEADQKSLADLALKANSPNGLSAAEKSMQQGLLDKSRKLNDDYQRLQSVQIGQATDQDRQQLDGYIKLATATETRAKVAQQSLQTEMQAKIKDTAAAAQKSIKDTLEKVSKEKGYAVVFSSDVAPYTEFDCTDDVLKVLNKK
jgi:Skp family chaperone for outer membrane proteins